MKERISVAKISYLLKLNLLLTHKSVNTYERANFCRENFLPSKTEPITYT